MQFTRVLHKSDPVVYKGFLEQNVHNDILSSFCKHGYDYAAISSETRVPVFLLEYHIVHILTCLHISGFELPYKAYPVPFNIKEGEHYDAMVALLNEVKEQASNKKNKLHHKQFMVLPKRYRVDSVLYTKREEFQKLDNRQLKFVMKLVQIGVCSLKEFTLDILASTYNYRADTATTKFNKNNLPQLLSIYKVQKNMSTVGLVHSATEFASHCFYYESVSNEDDVHVLDSELNIDERVRQLKRIIKNKRWDSTFRLSRLENDLHNMHVTNKKQFRYTMDVKLYAHCLLNYLGKAKYQMILGMQQTESDGDNQGHFDTSRCNELLPSISLLEQHRLPMITEHGVFHNYIAACSKLVTHLQSFQNLWVLMVDSVDLQANLTVSREKGMIFGISGQRYKISEVFTDEIFSHLDALKHLARKATVVLLCHGSNHFAIPVTCGTCISETHEAVVSLLDQCVTSCLNMKINIQMVNSDGGNYSAVKEIAEKYSIAAVNCACHLGKNIRNHLKEEERCILVPVHRVDVLGDHDLSQPVKCIQEGINFITITVDNITEKFGLDILIPGAKPKMLFEGMFYTDSCDLYFDEAYESSFTYGKDKKNISFSMYSLSKELSNLVFRRSGAATADVECTGYVVQQVSMETIRATYEHRDHSSKVQKLISWECMHVTDKMKESFMADICTSQYLEVLRTLFSEYPGLYKYLELMHNVYHPAASGESLDIVVQKCDRALKTVEEMRELTVNFSKGLFGVTKATYNSLLLNLAGYTHMQEYLKKENMSQKSFKTRLLLTNRLEGLFGQCRLIMRRYERICLSIVTKLIRRLVSQIINS